MTKMMLRVMGDETMFVAGGVIHMSESYIKMAFTKIDGSKYVVDADGDMHMVDDASFERVKKLLDN